MLLTQVDSKCGIQPTLQACLQIARIAMISLTHLEKLIKPHIYKPLTLTLNSLECKYALMDRVQVHHQLTLKALVLPNLIPTFIGLHLAVLTGKHLTLLAKG